jgi:SAM-dependent methyltransferase/uncharacterized protein YbaR (Trm112 family)
MQADELMCPESGTRLTRRPAFEAPNVVPPIATGFRPVGRTDELMVREDGTGAYPILKRVPVLLAPELLTPAAAGRRVDVTAPPYAEAYAEMEHYSSTAEAEVPGVAASHHARHLEQLAGLPPAARASFPLPARVWLDAAYELAAQADAYGHVRPLQDAHVLQLGGRGAQAVALLLAGAAQAWVATPMVGELLYARALAEHCGVADRLHVVAALAEELPFPDAAFDVVYSQGCVHHWVVAQALPECARVLRPGGRFAAVEPWRGPLYGLGTKILGKRDRAVQCEVLTAGRILPAMQVFADARVQHHGALTRYPLLALWKAGVKPDKTWLWRVLRADDAITARFPRLRRTGSSVALLGRAAA